MWQPIETAPKDGTRILLVDASDDRRSAQAVTGEWEGGEWRDMGDVGCNGQWDYEPTHWMPLPAPPHVRPEPDSDDAADSFPVGGQVASLTEPGRAGFVDLNDGVIVKNCTFPNAA